MQDSMPSSITCLQLLNDGRHLTMHCVSLCSLLLTLFVELSGIVAHQGVIVHSVGCSDAKSEWCNNGSPNLYFLAATFAFCSLYSRQPRRRKHVTTITATRSDCLSS
jgi:hypothetical protein